MPKYLINLLSSKNLYIDPVAIYVRNNLSKIDNMGIEDIATATGRSTAAVVKWCKKLGFSGFKEFKQQIIYELIEEKSSLKPKTIVDNFIDNMHFINNQYDNIVLLVKKILQVRNVAIIGSGGSKAMAEMLVYRLVKFGIECRIDDIFEISLLSKTPKVIIIISPTMHSFITPMLEEALKLYPTSTYAFTANPDIYSYSIPPINVIQTKVNSVGDVIEIDRYLCMEYLIYLIAIEVGKFIGYDKYYSSNPSNIIKSA